MKSFELPIDRWRNIERGLRVPLDEIERHRSEFVMVEARLNTAVEKLRRLDLGAPFDFTHLEENADYVAIPYAEKLAFERRHSQGTTGSDYRSMRLRIENDYDDMLLSCDLLKEMHKHALGFDNKDAGRWKARKNYFPIYDSEGNWVATRLTTPIGDVPEYMEGLHEKFHQSMNSTAVNPLLWIAGYTLDLFAIHPFQDGNGRVTRLTTLLTLNQAGHHVARYVNLEGAFTRRRSAYVESIVKSYDFWSGARHDPSLWCKFIIDFVLDAYREFSSRTAALGALVNQTSTLSDSIAKMSPMFRLTDLMRHLPEVPKEIVVIVLNRMRERGKLGMTVHGKEVAWHRETPDSRGS